MVELEQFFVQVLDPAGEAAEGELGRLDRLVQAGLVRAQPQAERCPCLQGAWAAKRGA